MSITLTRLLRKAKSERGGTAGPRQEQGVLVRGARPRRDPSPACPFRRGEAKALLRFWELIHPRFTPQCLKFGELSILQRHVRGWEPQPAVYCPSEIPAGELTVT